MRSNCWNCQVFLLCFFVIAGIQAIGIAADHSDTDRGDRLVAEYFRMETDRLTRRVFSDIDSLDDWTQRRGQYRRQLLEMLGLDPMPARTPLQPVVTGTVENEGVIVERLHFQSMPGLYVTANLYRPREQKGRLPTILYVCGHGGEKKDGVSLGNKTHYQHHGGWFARNGYVCLVIDTIQLGEIEGIHHGTYREKMWWWNNRGYTPAGVEAWNCLRSLDYLETRPEVDAERFGVTGRSGGGAYSWWIAAIDERVKVAVPVAGITSLHNHVVDGTVEGHCDCMFMLNTYRWDYPMVAALVAPRPLLISNSDKDRIFPLDGVIDVHAKVRKIYELYDAEENLGLQITEGPHRDTQELRVHAFRWFNRFLKNDDSLIETTAVPLFEKEQLRVFDSLPSDQRVTSIHESFVPEASSKLTSQSTGEARETSAEEIRESLATHCFRGWPAQGDPMDVQLAMGEGDANAVAIDYTSQLPYRLRMYALGTHRDGHVKVNVVNESDWPGIASGLAVLFPEDFTLTQPDPEQLSRLGDDDSPTVFVLPRGVGPTQWSTDERTRTHIRRRFMQLGQTAATMQIYDVKRGLHVLRNVDLFAGRKFNVTASGDAAVLAAYAVLMENADTRIHKLSLNDFPRSNREAPDILNVSRFIKLPQVSTLVAENVQSISVDYRQPK